MDKLTREQRRKNMQANKSKGTSIERLLAKHLWQLGLRYRKNVKKIQGTPDFVFVSRKIAVFCDGDFWHGRNWEQRKNDHKSNIDFWHSKIEKNILRDAEVTNSLTADGWNVIRLWGSEIKKNPAGCANRIKEIYENCQ